MLHATASTVTCWLLLLTATLARGQDPPRLVDGAVGERLWRFAERAEAFGFHGAVLAARGGKVAAAFGVGAADPDGNVGNDANTLFELASITKQFTAAAVLVLAQQHQLQLDDPIAAHLPGVPEDCRGITVRHLLQHTSGIPGGNGRGSGDDLGAVLPKFLAGGPRHPPGAHWEYWNQGYALLAAIVERASGASYAAFCRQQLFAKAGMRTAAFTGDQAPDGTTVAIGSSPGAAPRSALAHPYGSYGYQYRGMGGAVASAWDLWRWDRALRGDAVLTAASKKQLFAPGLNDYGLGWFVRRRDGRLVQSHAGSVRGFLCDLRRYPQQDACLAVLSNRTDAPVGELANALEEILFGGERELPPAPLPAALGEGLVGTWTAAKSSLVVEATGRILRARIEWQDVAGMLKTRGFLVGDDLAQLAFSDWHVRMPLRLERSAAGTITSLHLGDTAFERQ